MTILFRSDMEVLWKDIPGYEGLYQASTDGQIRTVDGKITSNSLHPIRVWKQRIMKQKYGKRKNGLMDAKICLWKNGKEKTFLVSRLVAMTWVDGYKEWLTVNHKDGNPLNNNMDNLEWVSLADNIRHGFASGLYKNSQKKCTLIDSGGNEYCFDSNANADRFLGRKHGYINNCIAKGHNVYDTNHNQYLVKT